MRYQVKFKWNGKTLYGIVETYSDEAKAAAKKGNLIINDAVLPVYYEVKDDKDVVDIDSEYPSEVDKYVDNALREAIDLSNSLEGVKVGKLFSIGVGDGYAWYIITIDFSQNWYCINKVNRKTCVVEWRGFCADRWHDHHFQGGGTFPISEIERYVKFPIGALRNL